MRRLAVALVITLALSSLCQARDTLAPLSTARVQPAEMDRLDVDIYPTGTLPSQGWRVSVSAVYRPTNYGDPGTMIETENRSNCLPPSGVIFVPVPDFFSKRKCKGSYVRTDSVPLKAEQVSLWGEHGLAIDFPPVITSQGNDYEIEQLNLTLLPCKGCDVIRQTFSAGCWTEEPELEILAKQFLVSYRKGSALAPKGTVCGLQKGGETYWASRKDARAAIRGRYNQPDTRESELLYSFVMIPTPENGWVYNPTWALNVINDIRSHFCVGPANAIYQTRLEKSPLWPYDPDVEVRLTLDERGRPCAYTLTGTATAKYTEDVRMRYVFIDEHLAQVDTAEPNSLVHVWRWVDDLPAEYVQRLHAASDLKPDQVLYWHKTAARYWPKEMDYTPDLALFAQHQAFAQVLKKRFPPVAK